MGTTDFIVSADPAGAYDLPSWTLIYNVYQTLLQVPPGTTKIVPEAASCAWHATTTYVCTLIGHQKFSNGDALTGSDVVYSFQRVLKIASPNGPSSLLSPMKSVSAVGNTVTFKLKAPDSTWPYVLTTAAGAIVDSKVFPFKSLKPDASVVGSGPYELHSYTSDQLAVFLPNPHYGGADVRHNSEFIVRYEQNATTLVSDVESGAVDLAYRDLTPTELLGLSHAKNIKIVQGKGIEIRYLVFNLNVMPGGTSVKKYAIRKAIAYLVNRQSIAKNVYHNTVSPLYSLVPDALVGHTNSFKTAYGGSPSVAKAKAVLKAAGITKKVSFTLWYNTNHYQDTDEAVELQRELDSSGLFSVSLQSAEWTTYSTAALTNQYGVFLFGWFPDYPDADDYTAPFLECKTSFLNDHWCNTSVDVQIAKEESTNAVAVRNAAFAKIQAATAAGLPLIPLWQGGQVAAIRTNVTGVASTLDPSYTFRFWLVGKS
jgi:peptide/nickel transport system substrate-binding protein